MRSDRPVVQVLAIALMTMLVSLVGMFILIGEVRQELMRLVSGSLAVIISLHDHPLVWRTFLAVLIFIVIYLVARASVYVTIPSLQKAHKCPLCDSSIQRVHRRKPERILSTVFILRIGRFNCVNCDWNGLRRYHKHQAD
jgi:hypothetical protein